MSEQDTRQDNPDGKVDAIAAIVLITVVIVTAIFWITNQ